MFRERLDRWMREAEDVDTRQDRNRMFCSRNSRDRLIREVEFGGVGARGDRADIMLQSLDGKFDGFRRTGAGGGQSSELKVGGTDLCVT